MVLRKAQGSLETCDIVLLKVHVGEVVLEKETSVTYIYIYIYIHQMFLFRKYAEKQGNSDMENSSVWIINLHVLKVSDPAFAPVEKFPTNSLSSMSENVIFGKSGLVTPGKFLAKTCRSLPVNKS